MTMFVVYIDRYNGGPKWNGIPTPGDFYTEISRILESNQSDPESSHSRADDLIIATLSAIGYSEGAKAFDAADKWYA